MATKEKFEWIRSWSDYAPNTDKPRVLLIGDSITNGYNEHVRELLRDVCYVDFFATSYTIESGVYLANVRAFLADAKYDLVHFNFGLHGFHLNKDEYKARVRALAEEIALEAKVISVTSTPIRAQKSNELADKNAAVIERNEAVLAIAKECGFAVDDLYPVARELPFELTAGDGFHYTTDGYKALAAAVADCIKSAL